MTDDEINGVVSELLHKRFDEVGFEHSTVQTEEDFDGSSIIRVKAHFNDGDVASNRLFDAQHDIRSELVRRGEQRFVFLNRVLPRDQDEIEDDLE
jgi:hypothetical protein